MAGENAVAGIDIVARLDRFREEMAKIPDIGGKEAKALTAQLSKEIRAAEAAAKKAAQASRDAANNAKGFGDVAGKTGQASQKLAGALSLISPAAGSASRDLADLADVGEVASEVGAALGVSSAALGVALLAVAEAAAVAYVAWRVYSEDATRAAETSAMVAAAQERLGPLLDDTRTATLDLRVAMGEITEEAGKMERASIQAFKAYQAATSETKKQLGELKASQSGVWTQMVDMAENIVPTWTPLGMVIDGLTTDSKEYGIQIDALQGSLDNATAALGKNVDIHHALIEAEAGGKKATRELANEYESLALAQEHVGESTAALTDGIQALLLDAQATTDGMLTGAEKVTAAYEAERARIEGVTAATLAQATTEEDRAAVLAASLRDQQAHEAAYYAELDRLRQEDAKKQADAAKKAEEAAQKQLEMIGQTANQVAGYVSDALGGMEAGFSHSYEAAANNIAILSRQLAEGEDFYTDAQKEALEDRIDAQEKAARASFEGQKIAAMSEAAINTAVAVSEALASAPPPYNALPAGIALAAGIAQEALIASEQPAFHSGGLAPDEGLYKMLAGEVAVSKQGVSAAGGREAFDRANAGVSTPMGGGDVWAVTSYRHTAQVARYERDRLARNSPTMQEISKGRTPGVRGL